MKVAYLIVAHHQPNHLARLVNALDCEWSSFFIHIDKKFDIEKFRQFLPERKNIIFLELSDRRPVNWGGFSVVETVLFLLSRAYESDAVFDRFCLLSGDDFPIKSLNCIHDALDSNAEFMRIDKKLSGGGHNTHTRFVSYHHFTDSIVHEDQQLSGKIERKIYDRIDLYHGSAWWSLTRNCIDFIIDFIDENPDYLGFHRTTLCPDEIFFQSIVKASPYAENILHDFEKAKDCGKYSQSNEHGCHYIDWNAVGVALPKVLTVEDACKLHRSKSLFARKFDECSSGHLIDMLAQSIELANQSDNEGGISGDISGDNEHLVHEKIWVIGEARSGTTWLAELINFESSYQFVFEPFHPQRSRAMLNFEPYSYRRTEDLDSELERFTNKVFSGKVFPRDSRVSVENPMCAERVLVKDILSQLISKWVMHKVPGLKTVIILRHPFAIALSKHRLRNWNWMSEPTSFLKQQALYDDYLQTYENIIRSAEGFFEQQVTIWSIVHNVMFQLLNEEDFHILYYEDLCRQPDIELSRLMHYLGHNENNVKSALLNIDRVSRMSSTEVLRHRGRENYADWLEQIDVDEIKRGYGILKAFDLDCIYNEGPDPLSTGINEFKKKIVNL